MAFNAGDIEANLTLDRTPFNEGLVKARADAEKFEKRGIKLRVDVDKSFTNQIQRALNETQKSTGRGIRLPVSVDDSTVSDVRRKIDQIADNTELTAKRSGNRIARGLLNPLVIELGLLPGIAAAAAAAGGLALGALPAVFAAIGVAAVKSNETLAQDYANLWDTIKSDTENLADPLVGTFEQVANEISGAWLEVRGDIGQIFKDIQPMVLDLTQGVLGMATEAMPKFREAIAQSGPAVRGLEQLLRSVGSGLGTMFVNASQNSVAMGRAIEVTGTMIERLLGFVGTLISQFGVFWSNVGPSFVRTFDTLLDVLEQFTQGGLQGTTSGLNMLLGVVNTLLGIIGPFAGTFGEVAGFLLSAAAASKLLTGSFGLLTKAWGFLSPSSWVARLEGVGNAISNVSERTGRYVGNLAGGEAAGERFAKTGSKMGQAFQSLGGAIPFVGLALIGVGLAQESVTNNANMLAAALMKGGDAARDARAAIQSLEEGQKKYADSIPFASGVLTKMFQGTADEAKRSYNTQIEGMTRVERAQLDAKRAQADYEDAVKHHGASSSQARAAQEDLAIATGNVEKAQHRAAQATQDHTSKIIEQTAMLLASVGSRLSYQASLLSMESAQKALTQAITEHGVGSLEARQADIQYQQSILATVNSIGERVKAENAGKSATEQSRLATAAMHQEIARLAVEAGTNLPPALAEMASKLTDAELKAMGVTREVDNAGNSIYRLPPGKSLAFPTDAPVAQRQVNALASAIDAVKPGKWITFYVNTVVSGQSNGQPPMGLTNGLPGRAEGGPVRKNMAYWVGEKGVPELFFPDVDGFVLNGADSKKVSSVQAGSGGSPADTLVRGGDGGSAPGYAELVDAMAEALSQVLSGAKLEIEGDAWAKIVNEANLRNGAR